MQLEGTISFNELFPVIQRLKQRLLDIEDDIRVQTALTAGRKKAQQELFPTALTRHSKGRFSKLYAELRHLLSGRRAQSKKAQKAIFKKRAALGTMVRKALEEEAFHAQLEALKAENERLDELAAVQAENLNPVHAAYSTLLKIERLCGAAAKSGLTQLHVEKMDVGLSDPQSTLTAISALASASRGIMEQVDPKTLADHLK